MFFKTADALGKCQEQYFRNQAPKREKESSSYILSVEPFTIDELHGMLPFPPSPSNHIIYEDPEKEKHTILNVLLQEPYYSHTT